MNFNPVSISKKLLKPLDERQGRVLQERFGLRTLSPRTLESIGREYGITRERVRQLESFALHKIRQSQQFPDFQKIFEELAGYIAARGGLMEENDLLSTRARTVQRKPHLLFILTVGDGFERIKGDEQFYPAWTNDLARTRKIKKALQDVQAEVKSDSLFSQKEIVDLLGLRLKNEVGEQMGEEVISSLLKVSRVIARNALGEWGHAFSSYINPRGMRDYAYLAMRCHGSPMHFSETARAIEDIFGKPSHVQTVHNELIKDDRFVLVGRGLYALKSWGYEGGNVRDVIGKILSKNGPLSKDEIIKRVLKERHIKENTILVNLQNKNFFRKDEKDNYLFI